MKPTVFLIEDDPLIIRMYERVFRLSEFEILIAKNGQEAMHMMENGEVSPDIILLDIMMPEANGLEVITWIKKDPKLSEVPIIVLTNLSGGKESRKKSLELGAEMFLIKSQHTPQEIVEIVRKTLESKKS